jgi:mRNA interferase RelE/StbE
MEFRIAFESKADRFLEIRIRKKIDKLIDVPFPNESKRIKGYIGIFRIRVGDYKILYEVVESKKLIIIYNIDKRSKVYTVRDEEGE